MGGWLVPARARVLIADPWPLSRGVLSETLGQAKIYHETAASAGEMLAVLKKTRQRFDVVVADHEFWRASRSELEDALGQETKLVILAPPGVRGDAGSHFGTGPGSGLTRPVRCSQLPEFWLRRVSGML